MLYVLLGHLRVCVPVCTWGARVPTRALIWNTGNVGGGPVTVGQSPRAGLFWAGKAPGRKLLMQQDRGRGIAWPPAVTDAGKVKIQHLCTCSPDGEGRKSHYRVTGDKKPKSTSATHPTAGD